MQPHRHSSTPLVFSDDILVIDSGGTSTTMPRRVGRFDGLSLLPIIADLGATAFSLLIILGILAHRDETHGYIVTISQRDLAKMLGVANRKTVSTHLSVLQDKGFITTHREVRGRGRSFGVITLTDRVNFLVEDNPDTLALTARIAAKTEQFLTDEQPSTPARLSDHQNVDVQKMGHQITGHSPTNLDVQKTDDQKPVPHVHDDFLTPLMHDQKTDSDWLDLVTRLHQIGFYNPTQFVSEHDHGRIRAALDYACNPDNQVNAPGAYVRAIVRADTPITPDKAAADSPNTDHRAPPAAGGARPLLSLAEQVDHDMSALSSPQQQDLQAQAQAYADSLGPMFSDPQRRQHAITMWLGRELQERRTRAQLGDIDAVLAATHITDTDPVSSGDLADQMRSPTHQAPPDTPAQRNTAT